MNSEINKAKENNRKKLGFLKLSINNLKNFKKYISNSNITNKTKNKEKKRKKWIFKKSLKDKEINYFNKEEDKNKFKKILKKYNLKDLNNKENKFKNLNINFKNRIKKDDLKFKCFKIKCKYILNYSIINYNKYDNLFNRITIFHNQILVNNVKNQINFFAIYEGDFIDLIEFYKKYFHKIIFDDKNFLTNLYDSIITNHNKLLGFFENNKINENNYNELLKYKNEKEKSFKFENLIKFRLIIMINNQINFISNHNSKLLLSKNKGNSLTNIENFNINQNFKINLNKYYYENSDDFIILRNSYLENMLNDKDLIIKIWKTIKSNIYYNFNEILDNSINLKTYNKN